jgi:hypothetical protein
MDLEPDVVYVVVEFLANAKRMVPQYEILEEIPFERRSVTGVLFALFACGFLVREALFEVPGGKSSSDADYVFGVCKNITAYQIIKLGELGIDMNSLSALVKISEKQKQAAMSLAMQTEKLAELDAQARVKRADSVSKHSVEPPLPRDAVVDTLERLAMASELSIKEMKAVRGNGDVLKALMDAKEQALKALTEYQNQLRKGGPEHLGF